MKLKKLLVGVLLTVFVGGLFLTACERKGDVIAVVNGDNIYEIELNNMVVGLYGQDADITDAERESIYESLISAKLIEQDCKARGLSVTEGEIDEYIDTLVTNNGMKDKADFYAQLKDAYGYSQDFIRSLIKSSLEEEKLYDAVVADAVKEDEGAISAAYDQDPAKYKQVEVSHILVSIDTDTDDAAAKAKANSLVLKLINGEDFATLAKANSEDTGSAASGGSLSGFFGADNTSYVAEFVAAAVQLKAGEFTKIPVKTEFGYHIIKADAVLATYAEVKDYVKEDLYGAAKEEAYMAYVEALKSKATIERKLTFATTTEEDTTTEDGSFQTLK